MTLCLAAAIALAGCHALSKEARRGAITDHAFPEVQRNMTPHKGATFVWGGTITQTAVLNGVTYIEITESPLTSVGMIADPKNVRGRFLVRTKDALDLEEYAPGRLITVAGVLAARRNGTLDGERYAYPVIEPKEMFLWDTRPRYIRLPEPNPYPSPNPTPGNWLRYYEPYDPE